MVKKPDWLQYTSVQEFFDKIDWEGGPAAFFLEYTGDDFEGSPFAEPLAALREVWSAFEDALDELKEEHGIEG